MVSVPARRAGVAYATGKGLSQRRACTLLGVGRSALHYCSTKLAKDAPVLGRMAELAAQYPRYGYRRIAIFLGRDGHVMSFGRVHRLCGGRPTTPGANNASEKAQVDSPLETANIGDL